MIKYIKKLLNDERKNITAEVAMKIYKKQKSVIDFEIKQMDYNISIAAKDHKRMISYVISNLREPATDLLMKHYEERGFLVKKYKYPEIEEFHVLVIGW